MVNAVWRLCGLLLLVPVLLPLHRMAGPAHPGAPAEHLRTLTDSYFRASWTGLALLVPAAVLLAFTPLPRVLRRWGRAGARVLLAPPATGFAVGAGVLAGALTLGLSLHAFALQPALLDATSQLVHARYLASGAAAGPTLAHPEFHTFQYMVNLPSGWSSQYPPGHLWALAAGFAAGLPWLVGPLLALVAVACTARLGEELLDDPLPARLGALLLAASPFFLGHNATYMNHSSAAAWGALALLAAVRSRARGDHSASQSAGWALLSGAAVGLAFASRPLGGVTVGAVALLLFLAPSREGVRPPLRTLLHQGVAAVGGALVPLGFTALHNLRLFGAPGRFGYDVAQGPGHGPGFHLDPWGEAYTPIEAIAQASSGLLALGMDLLLTPASALIPVALLLLVLPTPPRGVGVLLLWALLPVGLHLFYWHHDLFLGPRLLHEFTPAWVLLVAVATVAAGRWAGRHPPGTGRRFDPPGALLAALWLSAAVAVVVLAPLRLQLYTAQWGPAARTPLPTPEAGALVFVHGDWSDRLAARLAGHGMRVDSIRAATRYTTSCELQEHLDARALGLGVAPPLRFNSSPDRRLEALFLPTGTRIVTAPGEAPSPACIREVQADRQGTLDLPPLLWRGSLPGLEGDAPLFARDLGPELNARLLAAHPARRPFLHLPEGPGLPPRLVPYSEGMALLWGEGGSEER